MEMSVEPGMLWRKLLLATALVPVFAASAACHASDADPGGAAWDAARARLIAQNQVVRHARERSHGPTAPPPCARSVAHQ